MALGDLGDTEGFDGEENQLYAFKLTDVVYKRTQVTPEGIGSQKFGELSDMDVSHAVEKRMHMLVCANRKWIPFTDHVREGRLIDIKIQSPYVAVGQQHKFGKLKTPAYLAVFLYP